MRPFVVATANTDKAREIGEVLSEEWDAALAMIPVGDPVAGFVVFVADHPVAPPPLVSAPDVAETGSTLEENARIKAVALCTATGMPAVADDTGLEVDALGGEPGVCSARFAGPEAGYADNVAKLLGALAGVPAERRAARFATVALLHRPDGSEVVARGELEGTIAEEPRGVGGFGYDSVFVPSGGDGRSFGEMTAGQKHAISHRGRAFRALGAALREEG